MLLRACVVGKFQAFFGESVFQPISPPYMSLVYTSSNGSKSAAFCAPESLTDIDA
jgi:hypothetical protein